MEQRSDGERRNNVEKENERRRRERGEREGEREGERGERKRKVSVMETFRL